jgi:hypothetical protein
METTRSETSWTLSAPASLVLLAGEDASDQEVIRLMLLEMVVRRMLKLSVTSGRKLFVIPKRTILLSRGVNARRRSSESLDRVIELLPVMPSRTFKDGAEGTSVRLFVRTMIEKMLFTSFTPESVQEQWFWPESFMEAEILPDMASYGFFRCGDPAPATDRQCEYTESGQESITTLWEIIEQGRRDFARWVADDAQRAVQFVNRAGPAMLLMPVLAPEVRKLYQQMRYQLSQRQLQGTFGLAALAEPFGPGKEDGFDAASYVLAEEIDRAWSELMGGLPGVRRHAVPNAGQF